MIRTVHLTKNNTIFRSEQPKEEKASERTRILPNNLETNVKQGFQKTSSAFLDYPIKGLKGDINSNFYEFLTMGIVPYLAGSAMFMTVFNVLNIAGLLGPKDSKAAGKVGKKMALGVVLYGLLKNVSKNFVTKPVKYATGVDTEMPYENIVYPLPKQAGEQANIEVQHQQRKVFDSKEFYRKDLLTREYFDKIAHKIGLGDNLNDSVSETSPIIQNIVATSGMAKSISSYCWAGVGVALAVQDSWTDFFDSISNRKHYVGKNGENFVSKFAGKVKTFWGNVWDISKTFVVSFGRAIKQLWLGNPAHSGWMKHSGKAFLGLATAVTTVLTANSILRAKDLAKNNNKNTIDKSKESTVI